MQAAMESLDWPEGASKPEFMTREYGKTTGERSPGIASPLQKPYLTRSIKDTQPSQTCSEGYTFSATALYWGVCLFLGSIN